MPRPRLARGPRTKRSIAAYEDEYPLLSRFLKAVKYDIDSAKKILEDLEIRQRKKKIDMFRHSLP